MANLLRRGALLVVTALALGACSTPSSTSSAGAPGAVTLGSSTATSNGTTREAPTSPTVGSAAPTVRPTGTAAADGSQWACSGAPDCVQTCALGAVSIGWLKAHPNADNCDDGCGWNTNMVACKDSQCVTLDKNGAIDPTCSLRPWVPKP